MDKQRDPEIVAFEQAVRRDATINHIKNLYRLRRLRGSARTWWAVREMLRKRREGK